MKDCVLKSARLILAVFNIRGWFVLVGVLLSTFVLDTDVCYMLWVTGPPLIRSICSGHVANVGLYAKH